MTLPSKSTESSSPNNNFYSVCLRDSGAEGLGPDDLPVLPFERNEDRPASMSNPDDDDGLLRQPHSTPPPLLHQQQHPEDVRTCKVCGDTATGMYFGALVCVPCKTFFLRYAGEGFSYECKNNKICEVTTATRTQCKYCRYQKCLLVGMCRRVRPAQVEAQDGQQLCVVCQDVANGVHFGVQTCEGCKKFFRRGLTEQKSYRCRNNQNCSINPSNRNSCRFCRFQKCIKAGMSREAIQMGRPSKMTIFENSHQRPLNRDDDKKSSLPPCGQSTGDAMGGCDGGMDHPIRSRGTSLLPTEIRTNLSNRMFPLWMEDALMVAPAVENGRDAWSSRYDHIISAGKPGWPMDGLPFVGSYSPPKAASDEGERSDGSACPDSTMIREETDPFLPVDYTMMQRTLRSGDWNKDGDFLQEWAERRDSIRRDPSLAFISGFQDASPGGTKEHFKQEVPWSDEEGPSTGNKRGRYDRRSRDCTLHQGHFVLGDDCQMKYSTSSAAGKLEALSNQVQKPSISQLYISDVTSSGFLTGTGSVGSFADTLKPRVHPNPFSVESIEDFIPAPGASETAAILVPPIATEAGIGSPRVSSSSSHPFEGQKMDKPEGQIGSTSRRGFTGHEFDSSNEGLDKDVSSVPDEMDAISSAPRDPTSIRSLDYDGSEMQIEEVGNQCWRTIKRVIPAYHRFVSAGTTINIQLKEAHEVWKRENPRSDCADELSLWIQKTVVPAYTTASVAYCKCLPDFTDFCAFDQRILIAGGQSQSRILVAALHWYDVSEKKFCYFLSWRADAPHRADCFKGKLRDFAERISRLHLDPIEAALLNALGMFSTDYPNLQNSGAIKASRERILTTMKSYIAANNSAPSDRLDTLCGVLTEAQVLGAEHVALTNTRTLGLPSDGKERAAAEKRPDTSDGQ